MSQRRPFGRATSRPGSRRVAAGRPAGRSMRAVLVGIVAGAVLLGGATPVLAAPRNPTDGELTEAQTQQEQAAAEVGRIAALVAAAESELERVGVQAEAAGTAYLAAEEALTAAQAEADRTAAELAAAAEAVAAAEARIATFSRDSYMNGSTLTTTAALLDSAGPGELIQRAALLDYVADNQLDVLGQLEVAKVHQANADSAARKARDEMAAAEEQAAAAKAEADAQLAAQQSQYDQVTAQKADLEQQLQAAQIHLLELQGARNAYEQWVAEKEAAEAAARAEAERRAREAAAAAEEAAGRDNAAGGGDSSAPSTSNYVFPTSGYISSCFGWRWGALHGGVDIAAPIGTPIYAATSGIVARSGFANGFGLAVYIRGDDGATTVYGHVNREFVSAGMRVHAGQLIAEVGNRGNSTGPHLHFEVHPSGVLYGGQINPMPWLRARGVNVGGC